MKMLKQSCNVRINFNFLDSTWALILMVFNVKLRNKMLCTIYIALLSGFFLLIVCIKMFDNTKQLRMRLSAKSVI